MTTPEPKTDLYQQLAALDAEIVRVERQLADLRIELGEAEDRAMKAICAVVN